MSDDKTNRGAQDRARVAGDEPYEVDYFASKHGISAEQARQLIRENGNSREELDAAAERLKQNA
jgi:acetyl-CoA acetyltransferase